MTILIIIGLIVFFTYFGGNNVPDILVKNKKILLGILLGLFIGLFIGSSDIIEGKTNTDICLQYQYGKNDKPKVCLSNINTFMNEYKNEIRKYLLNKNPNCEDFINENLIVGYIALPDHQIKFFNSIENAIKTDDKDNNKPETLGDTGKNTIKEWVNMSTIKENRSHTYMGYGYKNPPQPNSPQINVALSDNVSSTNAAQWGNFMKGIISYNFIYDQAQKCNPTWMHWGTSGQCMPESSVNTSDYGRGTDHGEEIKQLYSADEECKLS